MNNLKVLVVGSGGREHALAWALARSVLVKHVYVAPGNAGTKWAEHPNATGLQPRAPSQNVPIAAEDIPALRRFALDNAIDLTVVGPEVPLAMGIVDEFQAVGLRIFGPTKAAARLESSKAYAKHFMRENNIPTAEFEVFSDYEAACTFVRKFGRPVVVKADGLAAGKGVVVCNDTAEADAALRRMLLDGEFGAAGRTVVVEERLEGEERSVLAFCKGDKCETMPFARDHKRACDGDTGPNTGGMGVYTDDKQRVEMVTEVIGQVFKPTLTGLIARGTPYNGVLYAGLMLTENGMKVLEYNCRFGDPETQAILPLLGDDLADILLSHVNPESTSLPGIFWANGHVVSVVLASPGYPGSYPKGLLISGLDSTPEKVVVFHAGTARRDGQIVTNGGRVLNVTAIGKKLDEAVERAYAGVEKIHFEGMHYRRDIGRKALNMNESQTYASAGVDIAAGIRATDLMAAAVRSTYGKEVLAGLGAFGGLFDASALKNMDAPVLVASTDGVGTKTKVAARLNRWDTIGADLVNHCINDILVQGAKPLFFLDYVASSKLVPEQIAALVSGAADACKAAGCALLGGETAEMPGVYETGEFDLAGTIVGVVERSQIIDGKRIEPGDTIIGLPSSGLHTNGYSLARRALDTLNWEMPYPESGITIGESLLAVHRSYLEPVGKLWAAGIDVRGLAHITGGGFIDNLPRILPDGTSAIIQRGTWPELLIFGLIQRIGNIDDDEMFHVFNMGLGMLVIVPAQVAQAVLTALPGDAYVVGEIVVGNRDVRIEGAQK